MDVKDKTDGGHGGRVWEEGEAALISEREKKGPDQHSLEDLIPISRAVLLGSEDTRDDYVSALPPSLLSLHFVACLSSYCSQ
jgi:hypothetical protein